MRYKVVRKSGCQLGVSITPSKLFGLIARGFAAMEPAQGCAKRQGSARGGFGRALNSIFRKPLRRQGSMVPSFANGPVGNIDPWIPACTTMGAGINGKRGL